MVQCRSRQPRKVFVMSILLIVWIAFAVAVGMYARNYRDRDQAGWTILALVISPLLAWAFLAALPPAAPLMMVVEEQRAERLRFGIFLASFVGVVLAIAGLAYVVQ
jgi:hypothetical protein